jgi:sn-glycerol 3-phosphate transport system substrate-binding protein
VVDVLEKGVQGVEVGVAPLPGVPGSTGPALLGHRVLWILNLRPKEEQEAAWKFVKWLMEPEQQAEWFAGSGYLPVNHAAFDQPAAQDVVANYPLFQVLLDVYLNRPTTPAGQFPVLGPYWQAGPRSCLQGGGEDALRRSGRRDGGQQDHRRV